MILKFRSMIVDAEKDGRPHPAGEKDDRITKIGNFIRATRIDEYDIIGQTRKSLENRGFREVSPMNFFDNYTRFGWYFCDMRIATV